MVHYGWALCCILADAAARLCVGNLLEEVEDAGMRRRLLLLLHGID